MRNRLILLLAVCVVGCTAQIDPMPFELVPAEVQTARDLAERHGPMAHVLRPEGSGASRVVFVKVELLPGTNAKDRQAMVQHYRYADDSTIFSRVDLVTATVLDTHIESHYPTGLADEEIARARQLVHDDPHSHGATVGLTLMPRPLQVSEKSDTMRHHRVVEFLLLRGQESVISPRILVDLTDSRVDVRE